MNVSLPREPRIRIVAVGLCVVLLGVVLGANMQPAGAHIGYHTESNMVNDPDESSRWSFIDDPGTGALLSRHDLYGDRAFYNHFGFSDNFIWFSHEVYRTVDSSEPWTFCNNTPHAQGTPCPIGSVGGLSGVNTVGGTFDGDADLHLFEYDGFVGQACGNFSPSGGGHPVPSISGIKFDDRNADGARSGGEPAVPGWRMVLTRVSSVVDQPLGDVAAATTDGNGYYRFFLDGHLPGTYVVTEQAQDGWVPTTATSRAVEVREGIGAAELGGHDFGNRREADTRKTGFRLVDPPVEIDADRVHRLTVEAVVANDGPMPEVEAEDSLDVSGPPDCTITPSQQSQRRKLRRGEPVALTFDVDVLCTEPSHHPFSFVDRLTLRSDGVTERDPTNNVRSFEHVIPVIDYADLNMRWLTLDCPERIDIDTAFSCTAVVDVFNTGPYEQPNVDIDLVPTVPSDCTAVSPVRHEDVSVARGGSVTLVDTWTLSCATRSFHPVQVAGRVTLDHLHVRDLVADNDTALADDTVQVFQAADLRIVEPVRIACGERRVGPSQFTCTVGVVVENGGPATEVATRLDVTLSGAADCTFDPVGAHTEQFTLDAGGQAAFSETWDVSCTAPTRHTFLAVATVTSDEPHAEDRTLGNNSAVVRWVPMDVKPRSDPSSVNVDKQGLLPFAILSTPDFDASSEVVVESLLAGRTGYEDSVVGCRDEPEDVNDDSYGDLVCHADTLLTGLQCGDTTMTVTGRLEDGTPIESQDTVKVTGCH